MLPSWLSVTAILAIGGLVWRPTLRWWNGRAIFAWLRANTSDEGGETHKTPTEIAAGTRVAPERVVDACRRNRRILQSTSQPDSWSVIRAEPYPPEYAAFFIGVTPRRRPF